jgi:hypothetical protein
VHPPVPSIPRVQAQGGYLPHARTPLDGCQRPRYLVKAQRGRIARGARANGHDPCCLAKEGNEPCAVTVSSGTGAGARAWVARVAGIYTLADDFKPSTAICDLDFRATATPSPPALTDRGSRAPAHTKAQSRQIAEYAPARD